MALLKIYVRTYSTLVGKSYFTEELHLVEDAKDVVVHQGNFALPPHGIENGPLPEAEGQWGPSAYYKTIEWFGSSGSDCVRIIDYTKDGIRVRASINHLCYVCNDSGKTIERVEMTNGVRMSKA